MPISCRFTQISKLKYSTKQKKKKKIKNEASTVIPDVLSACGRSLQNPSIYFLQSPLNFSTLCIIMPALVYLIQIFCNRSTKISTCLIHFLLKKEKLKSVDICMQLPFSVILPVLLRHEWFILTTLRRLIT